MIALDTMGGDFGPLELVRGALSAAREHKIPITLIGNKDSLSILESNKHSENVDFVYTSDYIRMEDSPSIVLKKGDEISINRAFRLLKEKKVSAVISAGNSGATMVSGMYTIGKVEGVERPCILTIFPSLKGVVGLVDSGANVDCKPIHLLQFGIMAGIFFETFFDKSSPSIGLLSNGSEEGKGNKLTKESHILFKRFIPSYSGLIEGKEFFSGKADIIVCDGFVGNLLLKVIEGVADVVVNLFKEEVKKSKTAILGYLFMKGALKNLSRKTDYSEYGGGILLGINGLSIVLHGGSNEKAVKNALIFASNLLKKGGNDEVIERIKARMREIKL